MIRWLGAFALATAVTLACAQATDAMLPATDSPFTFALEAAAQVATEHEPYWGLAQTYAPTANYKRSYTWLEQYVKAGVSGRWTTADGVTAYATLAPLGSATIGEDVFQQGNTGRVLIEDAFVGLRGGSAANVAFDVSLGAQRFVLGRGLLLAVGAGNGFERGAALLAPRRAWQFAALARVAHGDWSAQGFYLDPNELQSSDTHTRLAGGGVEWSPGASAALGVAYFVAPQSQAPYPKAPATIIENGRDGLHTTDVYWNFEPAEGALAGLSLSGEVALQRNSRIDMKAWGFGAEVAYRFADAPFAPRISFSPRYFSGDDPATARLERFDSLFYDGAPATWSSGGNGSFAFYNSNLLVYRVRVDLTLGAQDFANINYWSVRAAKSDSPVQYGQAARPTLSNGGIAIISGFPERNLTQEFYFEHTRVLTQHLFLTWGVAGSWPQSGIKAIVLDGAKPWYGALVNLAYRY
jgi:hypothetical protein